MDDSPKKRAPTSDADRALAGRSTRTPAGGVLVHAPEDRTPITDVLPLAGEDESARIVLVAVWRHIDNLEMRLLAKIAATSGETHRALIDEHVAEDAQTHLDITEKLADIHGKSGQNGKLGELRRRVDALSKAAWLLVSVAVGGLGAAAIKLVMVVRAFDAVEARGEATAARQLELIDRVLRLETEALRRHRSDNRFNPAEAPDATNDRSHP